MPTLSTARFATILAVIVALFATGVAAGAAGAALIIGQSNSAGSTTTTLNSSGSGSTLRLNNNGSGRGLEVEADGVPPLRLIAPTGEAPMVVNSTARVTNLNADRLDGLTAAAFARANLPVAGHFNCAGRDMQAATSGIAYSFDLGSLRLSGGGVGNFVCPLQLPDGATVTAMHVYLFDNDTSFYIDCGMHRVELDDGSVDLMADPAGSGLDPGLIVRSDTTVDFAVVNNAAYAYDAICHISGGSVNLELHSVSIEYTVEGLPVV